MKSLLRRCKNCGAYTLRKDRCPRCGGEVAVPHPPKFSPEDKYQRYRLLQKLALGEIELREDTKRKLLEELSRGFG